MKNRIKIFFVFALLIGLGSYIYITHFDFYERGENDVINCNVGETFKIKFRENGSTGIINCWLNEKDSKVVKLIGRSFESGIRSSFGCDGCGGVVVFEFKAISTGQDTIKMASCFGGIEDESCKDYLLGNTDPENMFIIEVSK